MTKEKEGTVKTMKKENISCPERLGKVGGQAVREGVMMKAGNRTVTTCRKEDGTLAVTALDFKSVREKHKILGLPIIRGFVNFVEMMALSVKTMGASAEALGIEEEDGKFERWLKKHFGVRVVDFIMAISLVLGLALSVFLFMFLPSAIADLINYLCDGKIGDLRAVIEGAAKVLIFMTYLLLVSLMPDIKRTFMYHGAEHKSIACFESDSAFESDSKLLSGLAQAENIPSKTDIITKTVINLFIIFTSIKR